MKRLVSITLVLMLVFALVASVSVAAKESPAQTYKMTAEAVGSGEATANPTEVAVGADGVGVEDVTFTATEKGAKFVKWELHCEYDIVSGSMTDKVLVVTPKSDIHAVAFFSDGEGKKDGGKTAPKTGYPVLIVLGVMAMAVCGGVVATKKIKE